LEAVGQGKRIVYCDEVLFNYRTRQSKAFAGVGQHIRVEHKNIKQEKLWCVAAVSAEHGVEGVVQTTGNVNGVIFRAIFDLVKKQGTNFVMVLDQVKYHTCPATEKYCQENNI
jgi:hypothetical protein